MDENSFAWEFHCAKSGFFVAAFFENAAQIDIGKIRIDQRLVLWRVAIDIENVRILKDVRNSVNRQVNCDIANIRKTVGAAHRQIECIEYIKEHAGLEFLSPELAEMAAVRLENPEAPLHELGQMLSIPLGKSGVNHRLAKLCEIAGDLRGRLEPSPETQGGMK